MSNKVGKTTENRVNSARSVISSVNAHKERVARALDGTMGMDTARWTAWIEAQSQELSAKTDALYDAAVALAHERSDDAAHRAERDAQASNLSAALSKARYLLSAVDEALPRRFGLDGRMPRAQMELESLARNVTENLRRTDAIHEVFGIVFTTAQIADAVDASYTAFKQGAATVADEERKAEGLLTLRDRALAEWTRVYQLTASTIENIYRTAGEDALADRVRPTTARSSGIVGPDETQPRADIIDEPGVPAEPAPAPADA